MKKIGIQKEYKMKQNYLQNIGAFKATINKVITKEAGPKNKAAYYIEFKDSIGRICAMRLSKPFNVYDWPRVARLISLFKSGNITVELCQKIGEQKVIATLQSFVGKDVVIFVDANEYQGKVMFQVLKVIDEKFSKYIQGDMNDDPFSNTDDSFDDSNYLDAALNAFEGSKVVEDTIPF
jgi:hypothetical protein